MISGGKHWHPIERLVEIQLRLLNANTRPILKTEPSNIHHCGFSIEEAARINEWRL